MAFVKIEDKSKECELIVFPGVYEKLNSVWQQDQVVIIKGKVNYKDRDGNIGQELKILVGQANIVSEDDAKAYQPKGKKPKPPKGSTPTSSKKSPTPPPKPVDNTQAQPQTLFVQIKDPADDTRLRKLKEISSEHPGPNNVILVLGEGEKKTALKMPFKVQINDAITAQLHHFFDPSCIAIK